MGSVRSCLPNCPTLFNRVPYFDQFIHNFSVRRPFITIFRDISSEKLYVWYSVFDVVNYF